MSHLSRLEKLGTIFTRVRDLMRSGVMKDTDKPLWYDVMATFPPRDHPTYNREYQKNLLPEILYEEDAVRAQFYKVYGNQMAIDLTKHEDIKQSPCHRFLTKYHELQKEDNKSPVEQFEATAAILAQEGLVLKKQSEKRQSRKIEELKRGSGRSTKGLALLLQQALEDQSRQMEDASPSTTGATSSRDEHDGS